MSEIINAVSTIKSGVLMIKGEIESLKNIQKINIMQLPAYSRSMDALSEAINNFEKVYCEYIPKEHLLRFALIYNLETELNKFTKNLKIYTKWAKKIENSNCCCIPKCWNLIAKSPSKMEKLIENIFKEINPIIKEFIFLQDTIFGTAIKIEHPILRQAWMQRGLNELNNSTISSNIFCQYLFFLLKREENNNIKCEKFCMKIIKDFIDTLDKGIDNIPDGLLLPMELNEFKPTKTNILSVKAMLNIDKLPISDIYYDNHSVNTNEYTYSESESNSDTEIFEYIISNNDININTVTETVTQTVAQTVAEIVPVNEAQTVAQTAVTEIVPVNEVETVAQTAVTEIVPVNEVETVAQTVAEIVPVNEVETVAQTAVAEIVPVNEVEEIIPEVNINNILHKSTSSSTSDNNVFISLDNNIILSKGKKKHNQSSTRYSINTTKSELPCDITEELNIKCNSIIIKNTHPVKIPYCEGYGSNWPSELVYECDIPNSKNINADKYEFHTISFDCIVTDQGWGGTGHIQVRVQINDQMPFTVFTVWMNKTNENKYNFLIGSNIAKVGDHIKIWLCCPPWGGWEARLEKITGNIIFHKKIN